MKIITFLLATLLATTSGLALAVKKPDDPGKHSSHPEHEITVGNEKAAASGSTAEDKSVREAREKETGQGKDEDSAKKQGTKDKKDKKGARD